MLTAVEQTALLTRERILKIRGLMFDVNRRVKAGAPKIYLKDLMELVFRHPYSRIRFIEEAGIAQRKTASVYLRELERLGVLRGVKSGRELYYINDAFLALLIG